MTAKNTDGVAPHAHWRFRVFTLAMGTIAYQGAKAFLNPATGKVVPATAAGAGLIPIGLFEDKRVDATSGDKQVNIDLQNEISVRYFANGSSITLADVGKLCYSDDDQTVVLAAGARALCGRVMDVHPIKGVGVQMFLSGAPAARPAAAPALAAFAAGATAPADIVHGAVYDVPVTAAASTITLPTAAVDGTVAHFLADGTKNGHTVQYLDQAGSVALTTALVASKRHLTVVAKLNGKWSANAYVSP